MTPQIQLFGNCGLFDPDGQRLQLPTRKSWGLLAYLCQAKSRDVPREELAALLWPHGNEAQARASLRQELAVLRRGLVAAGIPGLRPSKDRIGLNVPSGLVDSLEIERLAALPDRTSWRAGADHYSGDFLRDLKLNAQPFEEWLWLERQQLKAGVVDMLQKLLDHDMAGSETDQAMVTAQRLLDIEPTQERAYRAKMRLLRRLGRRSEALQLFQHCSDILGRDLDAEPSMETRMLAEQIRSEAGVVTPGRHRPPKRHSVAVAVVQMLGAGDMETRLDAEDLAQGQDRFLKRTERVVTACGGFCLPGIGDRVIGVFGFPTQQHDDCDRAVQAALSLCAEPVSLASRAVLWPRSGIAWGEMLVAPPPGAGRDQGHRGVLVGDGLLRASGLAQMAAGGQVLAAPELSTRLFGDFELSTLPIQTRPETAAGHLVRRLRVG